ncbi:uncharacterized protein LOC130975016 [Arachis stenosperma]|uniref:uncharacterized protein LOC130975016 n=1 Tax=Arachis stenosperma TaxID=217475 RepID=UPI0025ACE606|nr:uncharacterized protein LOC130975016 [Arachis stenosperma]
MVKPYTPPLPYPHRLQKEFEDQQFSKFLEVFKKLEINIPLAEALEQMPLYAKFLKELINKKRSWNEKETVILTQECSAVIQRGLQPKLKDPGSFILSCTIGNRTLDKALCDLGANINLMPLSLMKQLAIEELRPTRMSLQMVDQSLKIPNRVVENVLVKVGEFIFPANFVILDMEEEGHNSIILDRPFLATARAIIDIEKNIANYKVERKIPQEFTKQQVKKLLNEAKKFLWDEPFLFRRCPDGMIRKCVPKSEMRDVLWHCHGSACGGHFRLE